MAKLLYASSERVVLASSLSTLGFSAAGGGGAGGFVQPETDVTNKQTIRVRNGLGDTGEASVVLFRGVKVCAVYLNGFRETKILDVFMAMLLATATAATIGRPRNLCLRPGRFIWV